MAFDQTETARISRIHLRDIRADVIIGIHPAERITPQPVVIHLTLMVDTQKAEQSDNLADCVDYQKVVDRLVSFVQETRCMLIEKLVSDIANTLLNEFNITGLSITLNKPHALTNASVSIELSRFRE